MRLKISYLMICLVKLISGISAEAASDYAAVSLDNCCYFFLWQHFLCSETCFPRIHCFQSSSCVSRFNFNVCLVDFFFISQ